MPSTNTVNANAAADASSPAELAAATVKGAQTGKDRRAARQPKVARRVKATKGVTAKKASKASKARKSMVAKEDAGRVGKGASKDRSKKSAQAQQIAAGKTTKAAGRKAGKIAVRNSPVHGRGVFATGAIRKGERVMEYIGEIISWKEADRRPPSDPDDPFHTFLFSLDDGKRVIDASLRGNDARWINHSCDPNCETEETETGRVFIEAIRDIKRGEELNYDYGLIIDEKITPRLRRQYQCLCGAANCRGTMLALPKRKKKK